MRHQNTRRQPDDWCDFVVWFKSLKKFVPRSWDYPKAPRWLWHKEYKAWVKLGRPLRLGHYAQVEPERHNAEVSAEQMKLVGLWKKSA